jgi:hypothetical protein
VQKGAGHFTGSASLQGGDTPMNRRSALTILAVPAFSALSLVMLAWVGGARHAPARGLTERQALDRTEPLCRLLVPSAGAFRLSAELQTMNRSHDGVCRFWSVDCTDAADRQIAFFFWNADTGDLLCAARPYSITHGKSPWPSLDRRQAARIARDAMLRFGIARQAPRWRLAGRPQRLEKGRVWFVRCRRNLADVSNRMLSSYRGTSSGRGEAWHREASLERTPCVVRLGLM